MQTEEIRSIWLADPPVMDWACQRGQVPFLITECEYDSLSLNIEDIKLLWTIRKWTFIKFMFYDFPLSFCVSFHSFSHALALSPSVVLRARFTNSVSHLFTLKLHCQDLLKTRSEELALKRRGHSYVFLHLKFPFQTQHLWKESMKMNHATQFTDICTRQITVFCAII